MGRDRSAQVSIVAAVLPPDGGEPEVCRIETTKAVRRFIDYRAGLLWFVHPATEELEGRRDLLRARDDVRCARMAARHRVLKQLLRQGRIFRAVKAA